MRLARCERERALALRAEGRRIRDDAGALEVSKSTVATALSKNGSRTRSRAHAAEGGPIALLAAESFCRLDDERARKYYDCLMAALNPAARRALEEIMARGNCEYQSEFARKYVNEGRQEGSAAILVRLLTKRFGALSEATLARVGAASPEDLERWALALLDAPNLEAVFEPSP